jgi:pilus assembly protein CpaD
MKQNGSRPLRTKRLMSTVALLGIAMALGACKHTTDDVALTSSVPSDYRLRHPIVIQEADRTIEVFVGSGRSGLMASQRAEVTAMGNTWLRDGTGSLVIEVPANTPNARAAEQSVREIKSLLSAVGVPPRGVTVRHYTPADPRQFATIRINYPRLVADAGPCGVWPEDIGPSIKNKSYLDNKQYWNFGCANQRNLAATVVNPADLVQPRPETPSYVARRTFALGKYRKGESTATVYPDDKNTLSDVGK